MKTPEHELMLSNNVKVKYRPFLVKEEKILLMSVENNVESEMINTLINTVQTCVLTDGIDVKKLPVYDFEWLWLNIRSKSVGETSKLKFSCEKCQTPNDYDINLDELEPIGSQVENTIALTDTIGVTMKYPTVRDVDSSDAKSEIDMVFDVLVSSIESIYDAENVYPASESTKAELTTFIENLNQKQFNKLQAWFEAMPKLKKKVLFTCVKEDCKHENEFDIEGIQSFFG